MPGGMTALSGGGSGSRGGDVYRTGGPFSLYQNEYDRGLLDPTLDPTYGYLTSKAQQGINANLANKGTFGSTLGAKLGADASAGIGYNIARDQTGNRFTALGGMSGLEGLGWQQHQYRNRDTGGTGRMSGGGGGGGGGVPRYGTTLPHPTDFAPSTWTPDTRERGEYLGGNMYSFNDGIYSGDDVGPGGYLIGGSQPWSDPRNDPNNAMYRNPYGESYAFNNESSTLLDW